VRHGGRFQGGVSCSCNSQGVTALITVTPMTAFNLAERCSTRRVSGGPSEETQARHLDGAPLGGTQLDGGRRVERRPPQEAASGEHLPNCRPKSGGAVKTTDQVEVSLLAVVKRVKESRPLPWRKRERDSNAGWLAGIDALARKNYAVKPSIVAPMARAWTSKRPSARHVLKTYCNEVMT
jgi:hypothetical protein